MAIEIHSELERVARTVLYHSQSTVSLGVMKNLYILAQGY